jgi:hypothetical protein
MVIILYEGGRVYVRATSLCHHRNHERKVWEVWENIALLYENEATHETRTYLTGTDDIQIDKKVRVTVTYFSVMPISMISGLQSSTSAGVAFRAFVTPHFWFSMLMIVTILLLPTVVNRFFWFDTHPSYADRLRVRRKLPIFGRKEKPTESTRYTRYNLMQWLLLGC